MPNPRFLASGQQNAEVGNVRWSASQSVWVTTMALATLIGAPLTLSPSALLVFAGSTALTLLR